MELGIVIATAVLLTAVSYVSACYYLNHIKWNTINRDVLTLTKSKTLFLLTAVVSAAAVIFSFYKFYHLSLLIQLKLLALVFLLLTIAAVDFRQQIIPNTFLLVGLSVWAVMFLIQFIDNKKTAWDDLKSSIVGAVIIGGFFLLMLLIFKNSIGMGDIKLFAIMGLFQGLEGVISSIFFSLLVTFLVSIVLLISKKKKRTDAIPFCPCILLGTVVSICLTGM